MRPVGVVLAGGAGRRMGGPKGSLEFEGATLAMRAARTLRPHVAGVVVSVGPGALNPAPGFAMVEDPPPGGRGPLAAIAEAFRATSRVDLLVLACDYPRVDGAVASALLEAARGPGRAADVVLLLDAEGREHPLVALWRRSCAARVAAAVGQGHLQVRALLRELYVLRVPAEALADRLHNVNRPEDL